MANVEFNYYGKSYSLNEDNCGAFFNDEVVPIDGLELDTILDLLSKTIPDFVIEYFETPCESCFTSEKKKLKAYPFLEYHFFAFAKNGKYELSSLSTNYETMSYEQLEKQGVVDSMYMVSIIVCQECNEYTVEIEVVND